MKEIRGREVENEKRVDSKMRLVEKRRSEIVNAEKERREMEKEKKDREGQIWPFFQKSGPLI